MAAAGLSAFQTATPLQLSEVDLISVCSTKQRLEKRRKKREEERKAFTREAAKKTHQRINKTSLVAVIHPTKTIGKRCRSARDQFAASDCDFTAVGCISSLPIRQFIEGRPSTG